ncbi:hypothetical protein CLAFUR4_12431 [Fulvia fulva]|nr:hypothetical protein CLAFUR4_12431 [Fulvia fulva]
MGKTAIVWDILSGAEVARFSAYEHMRTATFMRNGNIAFGNDQGNIILFEPGTSEHISARTIFDPITAIAPAADCKNFAIGYMNGSILIATLQPSFTILHTLNTNRSPSRITGLAWHGSSSKQKTDMLATQTQDGDLRVWSVPKGSHTEAPNIIRVLQRQEVRQPGPCWFAWSKNGRLIQLVDGETRAWDVRTKKVTYDIIPTIQGVVGIASYGATATLFTLGRNHTVQQYDINPSSVPMQVATAQHAPANTPPTPPTTLEEQAKLTARASETSLPITFTDTESSADEGGALSPLQKIAREMDSLDALESEIRDKVMPLSPSSHGGSVSSRSSGKGARRQRKYLYDRPDSSRASTSTGYDGTEFSFGAPSAKGGHESMSIRSVSSYAPNNHGRQRTSSNLRKEVIRSPEEAAPGGTMELFPHTKARMRQVAFRTPHYGEVARTPELLQREMLSVVFGWNDDIRTLIHEERSHQPPRSTTSILLAKWLGETGADTLAAMVGSNSMTSSDWMFLALSNMGTGSSQKQASESFVQRLLEKGEIHPAVAILLSVGEIVEAIEVYVSQQYLMEAILLTCLTCPSEWGRISHLLRKWGEQTVMEGQAELAVRCFSCTSIETTAPWSSPRAQDAAYTAQQEHLMQPLSAVDVTSPTFSIPSRSDSGRLKMKNAPLKLITSFGDKGALRQTDPKTTVDNGALTAGVTPILNSALPMSPGGLDPWRQRGGRMARDPSSARTATPGAARRKRLPSRGDIERAKQEAAEMATPLTAQQAGPRAPSRTSNSNSRRTSSVSSVPEPTTALKPVTYDGEKLAARALGDQHDHLPSPAKGVFTRLRDGSRPRGESRDRNPDHLTVQVMETIYMDAPATGASMSSTGDALRTGTLSPPLTGGSSKASTRGRAADGYISSIEEARLAAKQERAESRRRGESRKRGESRNGRASSRMRDQSANRDRNDVKYIKPAKRSPSSPVPMSPEELAEAQASRAEPATTDDENFYKVSVTSPVESHRSGRSGRSGRVRRHDSGGNIAETLAPPPRTSSRAGRKSDPNVRPGAEGEGRGRSEQRELGSSARSPSSPLPLLSSKTFEAEPETQSDDQRSRMRSQSANRRAADLQSRREASRSRRDRSSSRRPAVKEDAGGSGWDVSRDAIPEEQTSQSSRASESSASVHEGQARPRGMSRKQLAAKELEERRRSLARRPSAPHVPLPGEDAASLFGRPSMTPRSHTDLGDSPTSFMPPMSRSHTVDPDDMSKYNNQSRITGTSTPSAPIGLPATPRAMRHPKYMSSDPSDDIPTVPEIPGKYSDFGSMSGSSLSQVTGSALSQLSSSLLSTEQQAQSSLMSYNPSAPSGISGMTGLTGLTGTSGSVLSENSDSIGPLLPSTVFGQKSPARSASAPPEKQQGVHPMYRQGLSSTARRLSNVRKISPPEVPYAQEPEQISSIDAALYDSEAQVIIIPEDPDNQPMLAELQHLNMPPPPPPPPMMFSQPQHNASGMINIAIDEITPLQAPKSAIEATPSSLPFGRSATASPSQHRRNAPSDSGFSFRKFGDRMRSSSKNRTKSPPIEMQLAYKQNAPAPYESVPNMPPSFHGHVRRESMNQQRAQSPYEQAMAANAQDPFARTISPPINETSIPPSSLPGSRAGYRNPKEIRANMPPETLQSGVYGRDPPGGFL